VGPAVDRNAARPTRETASKSPNRWSGQVQPFGRNTDCQHIAKTPEMSIKQAGYGKKFLQQAFRASTTERRPVRRQEPGFSIQRLLIQRATGTPRTLVAGGNLILRFAELLC
jgi:hypothetical protein